VSVLLVCPICGRKIISNEGSVHKLRTRIILFFEKKTIAKCRYCKKDVEVPVRILEEKNKDPLKERFLSKHKK
jgi:L-lysine 2,3-aminomutase